ncbi:hypothetical protein PGT21_005796 [Puccinia graminis f. sp. tritici]|uniref:Uncharacterized protein n=1 Tax=Puccinia graminis f. sp. tritici TaxID=56615 RepID=A0A5B0MBJ2_PUCGR|nr:hypothetical protein PGTUg99_030114 [Puccinia graminis f. sp. tritici]KAA1090576.1 hypothetical protein PGT21_005796 [Puccinia graminis f. sp. tritici]
MCPSNNTYFKFSHLDAQIPGRLMPVDSNPSIHSPPTHHQNTTDHPIDHPIHPSIHSAPTKTAPSIRPIMVFVQYDSQVKAVVVRWLLARRTAMEINNDLDFNIHPKTMSRWLSLYIRTRNVVRDPSTYED